MNRRMFLLRREKTPRYYNATVYLRRKRNNICLTLVDLKVELLPHLLLVL